MSAPSLYSRLLGPAFEALPPALKSIHDARRSKRYVGRCDIRGGGPIARTIARLAGLPIARTDAPIEVIVNVTASSEDWIRKFGKQRMQSRLNYRRQRMEERLGPIVLAFDLSAQQDRIVWSLYSARLALFPVPLTWLLKCGATESLDDGRYAFDVSAHVRGIGLVIHYKGWLVEHE
ncbi:DUF4166 domain-containing protein [Peristeroidobacter soli]|uniref:DUF4166 domain-containing protein n=1 Tax=Peristeroidobacter soli TaxID=2497877 RepID=UPI00101DA20A|nr:DUF4166 domain-containing protein [Peristeroidobacter soli]